jgi:hypothetical protein
MHIPVFFCALICGWKYGLGIGIILPIMRSVVFGMPPMIPMAVSMAFELATYGFVAGLIYGLVRQQNIFTLYLSVIPAMLVGRIVWGVAMFILLTTSGGMFSFNAFIAGAFLTAAPGIIFQLIVIPIIMFALDRAGLVKFRNKNIERS